MRRGLDSLRLSAAILAAAVSVGCTVLALIDAPAIPVGAVFLVLVVVSGLSNLYRYADIVAALCGSGAYAVLEESGGGATAWAAATAALIVCVAAVRLFDARTRVVERDARRTAALIDELTIYDTSSTLLKRRYGELALDEEIQRARRTDASLTILLLAADPVAENTGEKLPDVEEEAKSLGLSIRTYLRSIDRGVRLSPTLFAAILPATSAANGAVVAHKLCRHGEQQSSRPLRCAVATFPDQAVSAEDLLAEAEAGLHVARAADLPIVTPAMLRRADAVG